MEMMGFLILAVTIIGIILFMRTYLASSYGKSFETLTERQEIEGFRAGVNSILQTTEEKSEKTILELLGIASYQGTSDLDFGPIIGEVNVLDELEWRMNNIYGKGKWYVNIPYPDIIPRYQVVIIIDTSGSLCDDVQDMKEKLPSIIDELRADGYNVAATIFMLPGGQECCSKYGVSNLKCENLFETKKYLHCIDMVKKECDFGPNNNEDWGNGLACVIEKGPYEGWYNFTAKIGIVLSDELPMGSELKGGPENQNSLQNGIDASEGFMKVFPFKALTCGNACIKNGGVDYNIFTQICCDYDQELSDYMQQIANATSGQIYQLSSSNQVSEKIKDIFNVHKFDIKPYLEAGTQPPINKNINSVVIPVPVSFIGEYTNIYINTWS